MEYRKIIHIDMDAFFAAVEQRNNPALRGKPVIVGGDPKGRGVVAACSYEARRYGIHSAMPSSLAYRLCPHAVFIRGNFDEYRRVSEQIHDIFYSYTDLVESMSIDEAYLDVTQNTKACPSATIIAREIRSRIKKETGLTASAGVSYNKFLAKVASDFHKPDGLTVITPEMAPSFIERLPIGRFYGVGEVTEKRMHELGIYCGGDLKRLAHDDLIRLFGSYGSFLYHIVRGRDDRPVEPWWERKSIGKEETLEHDIISIEEIHRVLEDLVVRAARALAQEGASGRTLTLKVRYDDFTTVTRSITQEQPIGDEGMMLSLAKELLTRTDAGRRRVRLLGISLSNLGAGGQDDDRQLLLPFAV